MTDHTGPILTVDLAALAANHRLLKSRFSGSECAAVVKANAYGLGLSKVADALHSSGCKTFFVATLDEGIELRGVLPQATIYIFHGPYAGEEKEYAAHHLIPVLNTVEQVKRWNAGEPFALHVDTGMNRLGLTQAELEQLHAQGMAGKAKLLISHLACANEPANPKNAEQLARFRRAHALLLNVPMSLCNSSGAFLGGEFHFNLARPGCALYGINPIEGKNPMRHVATLSAPILQLRTAEQNDTVGYGATWALKKGTALATVQLGYSDGYPRLLSSKGTVFIGGHAAPVAGRVSMDMIAVDISSVPQAALAKATHVDIICQQQSVNDLARASGTIGYEVLTRLGPRVRRAYTQS